MEDNLQRAQYSLTFLSPLGHIRITGSESAISRVGFIKEQSLEEQGTSAPLLLECQKQLEEYFSNSRRAFDLPLEPRGTAFQQKIWNALLDITYGNTLSYAALAIKTGNIKHIRAAGTANGKNPIAIIIPCHRVIGSDGKLVGYAGELWRKQWLLEHEEKHAKGIQRLF